MISTQRGDIMSKRLILFIGFSMLIIVGSLVLGFYSYGRARRYFVRDVVYIAPWLNEGHLHFSMTDIDLLNRSLRDTTIAAESRGSAHVEASMQEAITSVIYTEASYFTIHSLEFIEGGPWYGEGGSSIVLNQALAWRLFGATEGVVGIPVWIGESVYNITGVVRQNNESRYMAWMPMVAGQPVTALYIHSRVPNPLAVYLARDAMLQLHRRPADYAIVDINRFIESMNIRSRILLYLVWVCILIFLAQKVWQRVESGGKKAFKDFKGLILPLAGIILCVVALWGINDILMWLPNLANPDTSLFANISTVGVLPPDGYLPYGLVRLSRLSRYVNFAFIAGIVGLVNLLFCLRFGLGKERDLE